MCILDLRKLIMSDFYYNQMKNHRKVSIVVYRFCYQRDTCFKDKNNNIYKKKKKL